MKNTETVEKPKKGAKKETFEISEQEQQAIEAGRKRIEERNETLKEVQEVLNKRGFKFIVDRNTSLNAPKIIMVDA